MYVARVPNRGSPPAILLRESYREDGKVKTRTLANLTRWPAPKVEALQQALKGQPSTSAAAGAFEITRSLAHGHVAAVLGSARALGVEELIDPTPSRQRNLVTAMPGGPGDRAGVQAARGARVACSDGDQLTRGGARGLRLR